jgi:acyl-CoA hydrolase
LIAVQLPFPELTPDEAASLITHGQTLGCSGFTPAGSAKTIPLALARKALTEHAAGRPFTLGILTGASTGPSLDGALAKAEAIHFRTPYQSDPLLRTQINNGTVRFVDMHLSMLPQSVRYGFLGPVDWAVVEVADITAGGGIVLTSSVGATPTYLNCAKRILLEWNESHSAALLGMHDIFEPKDPPARSDIPVYSVSDRAGSPMCLVDPKRIAGFVRTNLDDECSPFAPPTAVTEQIGQNVAGFLIAEIQAGRIPSQFLPLQSGVGDIANSVLAALGASSDIPSFEMYTEVLQDSVIPLIESGRCRFASTCALTLSPEAMRHFQANLDFFGLAY